MVGLRTRKNQFPPQAMSPCTWPYPGDVDRNIRLAAITRDIVNRDLAAFVQHSAHSANWGFDLVLSWADALQVGQCRNQADGAVTTHSQVAHIVEEDDACGAGGIQRIAEQRADHDVRTAGLIHHGGAETIVLVAKTLQPAGKRSSAEIRTTMHYEPSWLAPSMGIDHPDSTAFFGGHCSVIPSSVIPSSIYQKGDKKSGLLNYVGIYSSLWIQYAIVNSFLRWPQRLTTRLEDPDLKPREFARGLGLFDSVMVVVGAMIGSGIFIVPAEMARHIGSAGWLLVAWGVAGMLTIAGALCYGELSAMMPQAGGMYVYLREAYSPLWGFLYGWTLFSVIETGTIAAVAVAFSAVPECSGH